MVVGADAVGELFLGSGVEVFDLVGDRPEPGLPVIELAELVGDEAVHLRADELRDRVLLLRQGPVAPEVLEEGLEAELQQRLAVFVAEDEVDEFGEVGPEPSGVGCRKLQ